MFELLLKYPAVLALHLEGPSSEDRDKFLQHCANQGMAHSTQHRVARELLAIARQVAGAICSDDEAVARASDDHRNYSFGLPPTGCVSWDAWRRLSQY